ncbi:MAG: hypothetical protein AAFY69_14035 [Pseudomonadota bacterium]
MSNRERAYQSGRQNARYCLIPATALALAACGGGGGGGSAPPPSSNTPPVLTGNLSPTFPENSTISFFLSVDDADGDTVTVTIGTSNDGQFFTLDTGTGEVRSTQAFDFEAPEDANTDNVYEQTVTLNDGTTSVTRTVTVTILNEEEPPSCVPVANTSVNENVSGIIATLAGTDPDSGDDAIAVFENVGVDDFRLDGQLAVDAATGDIILTNPLDAEAFEPGFSFEASADYRTNNLFVRCGVTVSLNDLPTQVTSGILITDNKQPVQQLTDLNGGGIDDFWVADESDLSGSGPIAGALVFGETLSVALQPEGAATLDLSMLDAAQAIQITGAFPRGAGNATSASVLPISDLDGDGDSELLFMADQPPSDGLDPTRRPWGFVVFAATIAGNTSGVIDLDTLVAADGFSLTGPVDFNGGIAGYAVADLDGVAGDELVIGLPEAVGTGAESGRVYVISGTTLAAADGNLDFDLALATKQYDGGIDIDAAFVAGAPSVVGDLTADGIAELVIQSGQAVAVVPSENLNSTPSGELGTLNPLLLTLGSDFSGAIASANVDGDALEDLLVVRGDGGAGTEQASIAFGSALQPIVATDSEVALGDANFASGEYLGITSTGEGFFSNPVTLTRIGDLDGDGRDEVAFGLSNDPGNAPGSIYILRGNVLASQASTSFDIDGFTAAAGARIAPVPFLFNSLTSKLSLTPDIDGDGHSELYVTSNQLLQDDPPGQAVIVLSSDVTAALNSGTGEIDLADLFFNEAP